jgi:hypothetical protein
MDSWSSEAHPFYPDDAGIRHASSMVKLELYEPTSREINYAPPPSIWGLRYHPDSLPVMDSVLPPQGAVLLIRS